MYYYDDDIIIYNETRYKVFGADFDFFSAGKILLDGKMSTSIAGTIYGDNEKNEMYVKESERPPAKNKYDWNVLDMNYRGV